MGSRLCKVARVAILFTGAALYLKAAVAEPDVDKSMSSGKFAANEPAFASRKEAEDFLTRTLPLATAANPKYVSKADKAETVWLTKSIAFSDGASGHGIQVSTDEQYTETRAGVSTPGTHQAVFSLGDVSISKETSDADFTEPGEPALGIIFKCAAPKCIQAKWGGEASQSDWTDIYLQDASLRGRILQAFEFLKANREKTPS